MQMSQIPQISMNIAVKQPTFILISLFIPAFLFMESAQSQSAPQIKGSSPFAPYQPEPKFAPAREPQTQPRSAFSNKEDTNGQSSEPTGNQTSNQSNNQSNSQSNNEVNGQEPFNVTPDGVPALNIVPTVDRPPIPPPPNAAPLRPSGSGIARPAQAWRVKAFQLFKQKLDPKTTIALVLNANYDNALLALRQAFEDNGLTVSGISSSSGHMLVTLNSNSSSSVNSSSINNSSGSSLSGTESTSSRSEKAIVAIRPALADATKEAAIETTNAATKEAANDAARVAKSKKRPEAKTELRVMCESRNRSLTSVRLREILNKLQNKFGDIKTDAETL